MTKSLSMKGFVIYELESLRDMELMCNFLILVFNDFSGFCCCFDNINPFRKL